MDIGYWIFFIKKYTPNKYLNIQYPISNIFLLIYYSLFLIHYSLFKSMSSFIIAALTFLVIPLGIFFLFGWLIFYHLKRYGLKGDITKKTANLFGAGMALVSIMIIAIFLFIDWDNINISDFIERSNINLSPTEYEYEYE